MSMLKFETPYSRILPLCLSSSQPFHRLLDRRVVVGPVDQHQVDEIGVEPPQAVLGVLNDVALFRVAPNHLGRVVVIEPNLGHKDDVVAPIAQRLGQQLLGVIRAVDLGRVEQRDPAVDRHVHGAGRLIDVDVAVHRGAHLPRAEAHRRGHQVRVAESSLFHGCVLPVVRSTTLTLALSRRERGQREKRAVRAGKVRYSRRLRRAPVARATWTTWSRFW